MKLLLVIDTLESGGAQRLFVNLANGLSQYFEIRVLVYNSTGNIFHSCNRDIKIIQIKKTRFKGFKLNILKRIWDEQRKSDMVISYMPSSNIYCAISRLFFNWDKKLICNEVSINNQLESKFKRFITNFSYILASSVVCNTYKQAKYLNKFFFLKNKTITIFNGCNEIKYKERIKKEANKKKLIVVGRIAYPKNGLRFLKALKLFHNKYNFLPYVEWAGRVDSSRQENKNLYKQMLIFLKNNNDVNKFFKFAGEIKDINSFYANSDGLILPSIYEGLSYVICEAMFNGCPILATNISDNKFILGENSEKGLICDAFSEKSIFEGIEKLVFLKYPKLIKMTLRARLFADNHFTVDKMINTYKKLINTIY